MGFTGAKDARLAPELGYTLPLYHPAGFRHRQTNLSVWFRNCRLKSRAGDNILMLCGIHLALCISYPSRDGMKIGN